MEVKVTSNAALALKEKLNPNNINQGVRVKITGIGWGGPRFGLVLDEPSKSDNIYESNGIKVMFDRETSKYTNGFTIDYKKSFFGNRFVVDQFFSSGHSCR